MKSILNLTILGLVTYNNMKKYLAVLAVFIGIISLSGGVVYAQDYDPSVDSSVQSDSNPTRDFDASVDSSVQGGSAGNGGGYYWDSNPATGGTKSTGSGSAANRTSSAGVGSSPSGGGGSSPSGGGGSSPSGGSGGMTQSAAPNNFQVAAPNNVRAGGGVNCNTDTGKICNPIKAGSVDNLLASLLSIVKFVAGIVLVIYFILAGFKYVTARGDEGKIKDAHNMLTWTAVGGAILLGAEVIQKLISGTINQLGTGL
jgi:hypothetical protein